MTTVTLANRYITKKQICLQLVYAFYLSTEFQRMLRSALSTRDLASTLSSRRAWVRNAVMIFHPWFLLHAKKLFNNQLVQTCNWNLVPSCRVDCSQVSEAAQGVQGDLFKKKDLKNEKPLEKSKELTPLSPRFVLFLVVSLGFPGSAHTFVASFGRRLLASLSAVGVAFSEAVYAFSHTSWCFYSWRWVFVFFVFLFFHFLNGLASTF